MKLWILLFALAAVLNWILKALFHRPWNSEYDLFMAGGLATGIVFLLMLRVKKVEKKAERQANELNEKKAVK